MKRETPHPPHGKCHKNIPIFLTLPLDRQLGKIILTVKRQFATLFMATKVLLFSYFFLTKYLQTKKAVSLCPGLFSDLMT